MKKRQVEILAPAGSYESMVAAVNAGADAVYIGGSRFGARAFADNLDEDRMLKAIDYVHLHGCKLYLTVNTLMKEEELGDLFQYLNPYYEQGLDAVIVQDYGVFSFIRENFPKLPIHASTQMTITGAYGARILRDWGAVRVVTARELSLEEIRKIHETADVEIESFVHGALCYCYSGQCLFSSLIGGRSGNRGRCAQTCRLPFEVRKDNIPLNPRDEQYVLSLKDLCTLELLPDIIEAGVYSLKIEGRMKSPRYTAGVVSIYRKYVDLYLCEGRRGYQVDQEDKRILLDLFDRGGFSQGYYQRHNGRQMAALHEKPAFREGNQKLYEDLDKRYVNAKKQEPVRGIVTVMEGQKTSFDLSMGDVSVRVEGQIPMKAENQPMTEEKIKKQMNKTGSAPFCFEELSVFLNGRVFLPVQALNELRRFGFAALEQEILGSYRRKQEILSVRSFSARIETGQTTPVRRLHVSLEQENQLESALNAAPVQEIYIDAAGFVPDGWGKTVELCHRYGKKCLLTMPHIFRKEAEVYFESNLDFLKEAGFDGLLIRSLEEVGFAKEKELNLPLVFDHGMYTWNSKAALRMMESGAKRLTLPVELNSRELEAHGCGGMELIVYGYLPMMVTAQCIQKTVKDCTKKPDILYIKDRMGKQFPVRNQCAFCYNTIYNASPLALMGDKKIIDRLDPLVVRLNFTIESQAEAAKIIQSAYECLWEGKSAKGLFDDYTRGHFKRGAE